MSLTYSHMWADVGHMWDTQYPHVFVRPHMCLTWVRHIPLCLNVLSHVGKRVKLKQHICDTM